MEKVESIYIYSSELKSKDTDLFGMFEFINLWVWRQPRRLLRQKKVGLRGVLQKNFAKNFFFQFYSRYQIVHTKHR